MNNLLKDLLISGRMDNALFIHLLKCALHSNEAIQTLVDFNCCDDLLLRHLMYQTYIGYHINPATIGVLKQQYPSIAENLSSVDVFKFSTGKSMGVDVGVALGLLHRVTNPIESMNHLMELHQPKRLYCSFITGEKYIADVDYTPVAWKDLWKVQNLTGLCSFRIEKELFWSLVEIQKEDI